MQPCTLDSAIEHAKTVAPPVSGRIWISGSSCSLATAHNIDAARMILVGKGKDTTDVFLGNVTPSPLVSGGDLTLEDMTLDSSHSSAVQVTGGASYVHRVKFLLNAGTLEVRRDIEGSGTFSRAEK